MGLERSKDFKFSTDMVCFRSTVRVDGQGSWPEALTLKDGSTTVSPFVCLEAR